MAAEYLLEIYLHCISHCLNLVVVKSMQVTCIRNMIVVIETNYLFIAVLSKWQMVLEMAIEKIQPETQVRELRKSSLRHTFVS